MRFHTPLVSFVSAIALASGITASVHQVRDLICPLGTVTESCCNNVATIDELQSEPFYPLIEDYLGDSTSLVGTNCTANPELSQAGTWYCHSLTSVFFSMADAP
jgi:hypothetical protein